MTQDSWLSLGWQQLQLPLLPRFPISYQIKENGEKVQCSRQNLDTVVTLTLLLY